MRTQSRMILAWLFVALFLVGCGGGKKDDKNLDVSLELAGTIKGNHLTTPAAELVNLICPVLGDYLRGRGRQALDIIEQRASEGIVLRDIHTAWRAARSARCSASVWLMVRASLVA